MKFCRLMRHQRLLFLFCFCVLSLILTFATILSELSTSEKLQADDNLRGKAFVTYFGLQIESYVAKGRREPKAADDNFLQGDRKNVEDEYEFHRIKQLQRELRETHSIKSGNLRDGDLRSGTNVTELLIRDNLFWSAEAESLVPKGLSDSEATDYIRAVQRVSVQYLLPPTWTRCGRPKNAYVVMHDGKAMCVRYRDPDIKLVLGEVLSFYLSRFLGMDNVPVVTLSRVSPSLPQWHGMAANMTTMQWLSGRVVALIQWIPNLDSYSSFARIPGLLFRAYQTNQSLTPSSMNSASLSKREIIDLIQWGTMIIFDYLTGHYDRMASMQDGAYQQKDPSVLLDNIRNLRKSKRAKLWLIDNESGLLDAYDLLYNDSLGGFRFRNFHLQMLQTMCVFQKSVVDAIKSLHDSDNPHLKLNKFAFSYDPLLQATWSKSLFYLYEKKFKERVKDVYEWIKYCAMRSKR